MRTTASWCSRRCPTAMGADAERLVFDTIDPAKDVDGFTPINVGLLVQNRAALVACTPSGVIELLRALRHRDRRARAPWCIGRSDIVGKPMAMLLLHEHATVTICHSRTRDLPSVAPRPTSWWWRSAAPRFVQPDFVKPGATVIDVGTNRVTEPRRSSASSRRSRRGERRSRKRGALVVGDVHPGVADVAGALTPVPGGVGPLTIALLLEQHARGGRGPVRGAAGSAVAGLIRRDAQGRADRRDRDGQVVGAATVRPPRHSDGRRRRAGARGARAWHARRRTRSSNASAPPSRSPDGGIDRKELGAIVFGDEAARRELEAIVHPAVYGAIAAWFATLPPVALPWPTSHSCTKPAVNRTFDVVVVTACAPEEQIRRADGAGGLSLEARRAQRIAAQLPVDREGARAPTHVIRTDGSARGDRRSQVDALRRDAVSLRLRRRAPWRSAPRRTSSSRGSAGIATATPCCGSGSACRCADRDRRWRRG